LSFQHLWTHRDVEEAIDQKLTAALKKKLENLVSLVLSLERSNDISPFALTLHLLVLTMVV
jgi:hypothetical protein